jgi:hypothetical protein
MPDEHSLRRPGFRPGTPIRLADGQEWVFPGPGELSAPEGGRTAGEPAGAADPAYGGLIDALCEAEDEPDRLRAELALGIFLLGCNYALGPGDYQRLLQAPRGATVQQAFRDLANDHAWHNLKARPQRRASAAPRRCSLDWLRAVFRRRVV